MSLKRNIARRQLHLDFPRESSELLDGRFYHAVDSPAIYQLFTGHYCLYGAAWLRVL